MEIQKKISAALLLLATLGVSAKPALAQKSSAPSNNLTSQTQAADVAVHHLTMGQNPNGNGAIVFFDNGKMAAYGQGDGTPRISPIAGQDNLFALEAGILKAGKQNLYVIGAGHKNNTLDLTAVANDLGAGSFSADADGYLYLNKQAGFRLFNINQFKVGDKTIQAEYVLRGNLPNQETDSFPNDPSQLLSKYCLDALQKAASDLKQSHPTAGTSQSPTAQTLRNSM